jgi:hypothetical protein
MSGDMAAAAHDAAEAGDYKGAVKALEKAVYPLYRAEDADGLEQIVREASRIHELAAGRVRSKASGVRELAESYLTGLGRGSTQDAAPEQPPVERVSDESVEVDVSPVSFGLTIVGAAIMLIAIFLKQFETNTFAVIEKNSLVQNGDGWWFIILAVLISGAAWRAYNRKHSTFAPVVFGLISVAVALYYGLAHSQLQLCSAASGFASNCTQARPGIGIYAAGVGGVLAAIGGWQMFRAKPLESYDVEDEIMTADSLKVPKSPALADRLRALDDLRTEGLVTEAEYDQRRAGLLDQI